MTPNSKPPQAAKPPSLVALLNPYKGFVALLVVLALLSNGLNLVIPKLIASAIDAYTKNNFATRTFVIEFFLVAFGIFVFTYLQSIVQTYASERVARDLRTKLSAKISKQSYAYIQEVSPAKLLTNLTSDIDSVKTYVSQAIVSIISSVFLIIGSSVLLLLIDWRLALVVLAIIPIIAGTFSFVLVRVRVLFKKSREVIDWLNRVINESILGAALIRVLNSSNAEYAKFIKANTDARDIGLQILRLFSALVPIITFFTNMAMLAIFLLGGRYVILGTMSLGNFTAFTSYLAILIFPIIIIGFMSNVIAQAQASYQRVNEVLSTEERPETGMITRPLEGNVSVDDVSVSYAGKRALKDVSFVARAGTKTAIIGPTAAGKTQLLYLLTALIRPETGVVSYDNTPIDEYNSESLHTQVGFVFQDSIIFNLSLRENIAFSDTVDDADLEKAIETAELKTFVETLPDKLNTIVSERGSSLSGGQKQRIMLARALALNPKVLLLDDFTARVDPNTERKILDNVSRNYPSLTLISVTQKIASVELYDQIVVLMEGEVLATGTHEELLSSSPEYVQIYNSQKSTSHYEELQA